MSMLPAADGKETKQGNVAGNHHHHDDEARRQLAAIDDDTRRELFRREVVSWPTLGVFVGAYALWFTLAALLVSTYGLGGGPLPVRICVGFVEFLCIYALFTVAHDCGHRSFAKARAVNNLIGRLAMPALGPVGSFTAFRWIHNQHHKHTNVKGMDPDLWTTGNGHVYCEDGDEVPETGADGHESSLLPLLGSWLTLDVFYIYYYLRYAVFRKSNNTAREVADGIGVVLLILAAALMAAFGYWGPVVAHYVIFHWLIPGRFAVVLLAYSFDYLPHHPHTVTIRESRHKTTSRMTVRSALLRPILTYAMFFQDFHCIHHLYPTLPFYKYARAWMAKEVFHEQNIETVVLF